MLYKNLSFAPALFLIATPLRGRAPSAIKNNYVVCKKHYGRCPDCEKFFPLPLFKFCGEGTKGYRAVDI
jgi:hypothetical protein